jgi:hypothetical protein
MAEVGTTLIIEKEPGTVDGGRAGDTLKAPE